MRAGKKVTFTRVALGDGSIGTGSIFSVIRLKSERFSLPIRSISYSSAEATVTALLTNDLLEEGFHLREMGLMATDPDTMVEGVYLYNRDPGEGEYLPDKNSAEKLKEYLRIRVKSSNASNIIFESDGNPIDVTQEDLDERLRSLIQIGGEEPTVGPCLWFDTRGGGAGTDMVSASLELGGPGDTAELMAQVDGVDHPVSNAKTGTAPKVGEYNFEII